MRVLYPGRQTPTIHPKLNSTPFVPIIRPEFILNRARHFLFSSPLFYHPSIQPDSAFLPVTIEMQFRLALLLSAAAAVASVASLPSANNDLLVARACPAAGASCSLCPNEVAGCEVDVARVNTCVCTGCNVACIRYHWWQRGMKKLRSKHV